jgi:hypothetical protein
MSEKEVGEKRAATSDHRTLTRSHRGSAASRQRGIPRRFERFHTPHSLALARRCDFLKRVIRARSYTLGFGLSLPPSFPRSTRVTTAVTYRSRLAFVHHGGCRSDHTAFPWRCSSFIFCMLEYCTVQAGEAWLDVQPRMVGPDQMASWLPWPSAASSLPPWPSPCAARAPC